MRRARAGGVERAEMARARCGGDERVGVIRRVRLVEFDVEDDAIKRTKDKRRNERRAHRKLESLTFVLRLFV